VEFLHAASTMQESCVLRPECAGDILAESNLPAQDG